MNNKFFKGIMTTAVLTCGVLVLSACSKKTAVVGEIDDIPVTVFTSETTEVETGNTSETVEVSDAAPAVEGTWQTASIQEEEDGSAHPYHYVRFTDSEIQYGHFDGENFVVDFTDQIVNLTTTEGGGYKIKAESEIGVQYTYMTCETDENILEYYDTWDENQFPLMYRGGSSLSKCE